MSKYVIFHATFLSIFNFSHFFVRQPSNDHIMHMFGYFYEERRSIFWTEYNKLHSFFREHGRHFSEYVFVLAPCCSIQVKKKLDVHSNCAKEKKIALILFTNLFFFSFNPKRRADIWTFVIENNEEINFSKSFLKYLTTKKWAFF